MKRLSCMVMLAGFFFACQNSSPPKTTAVEFSSPRATSSTGEPAEEAATGQELGDGIRIKFITASGEHWDRETAVQSQVEAFINSGKYEIVRVSTTRCNSQNAHLLSAEIYYRHKEKGEDGQ